jgi:hypothetical protein
VINLDEPRFTMLKVAKALSPKRYNTLQSLFQRGIFKLSEAERAEPGFGHAISLRTASQVGIAWHL